MNYSLYLYRTLELVTFNMQRTTKYQAAFAFTWIFLLLSYSQSYRFEPNTLTLNNFSTCITGDNKTIDMHYSISQLGRNKYIVDGQAIFTEFLPGPLEVN